MSNIVNIKGDGYAAKINLSRGANCISLTNEEFSADILRTPKNPDSFDNPYLYGMPLLFPQNRISGGSFTFDGRRYVFPINEKSTGCHLHGTIHQMEFSLVDMGEHFVRCRYSAKAGAYLGFLNAFSCELLYSLDERGLLVEVEFSNLSDTAMPIFFGFHTTFNIPFIKSSSGNEVSLLAELCEEIERDYATYLPTGKILPKDAVFNMLSEGSFHPSELALSRHYKCKPKSKLMLFDRKHSVRLVYENDEKYIFRLIYNGGAKDYISLEPLTSAIDAPNSPLGREYSGFSYINSGRNIKYVSRIYLEKA